jgi:diguanylate cyclase (GGDEF)-like protein
VTWIAAVVAIAVAALLPLIQFIEGRRLLLHDISDKASVKAELLSELAALSPDNWAYQDTRLLELLRRHPLPIGEDSASVLDAGGRELVRIGERAGSAYSVSAPIRDAGVVVGYVAVGRSVYELHLRTTLLGLAGIVLGTVIFLTLRTLPLRALGRTLGALEAHLRYQEKLARFGHSALGEREAPQLIEQAVHSTLEALTADVAAYVEPGPGERTLILRKVAGLREAGRAMEATYATGDVVGRLFERGELQQVSPSDPALPFDWALGHRGHAVLAPVLKDGRVRGALCALMPEGRAFGAEERTFLATAANVLAAALQRIDNESRLAFLAQFDPLTGLPNRALLNDRFSQMIVQARRQGTSLGVLFIDLDEFKLVNDTLGHAAGDEVLMEAGNRLQAVVRGGDTVARMSGDEFAVVLADLAQPEHAALVAQKIGERLAAPFAVRGHEVFVTASAGIALFPSDGDNAESLIGAADAAMYRAKKSGNTYQFYTSEINQRTKARAQLGSELRRALEREEFALVYQPKYDLATGEICAAEALLRWRQPERGMVSPAEFVPILEETGLILTVGEWVIRRACEDLKAWQAARLRVVPVAVNLSARQFRQPDLDKRIAAHLAASGMDPALFEVEITESQLMHDRAHAVGVMRSLTQMGIRIAIDDFGTGYSSLSYLTQFPVSSLKIDRSFVGHALTDEADAAVVRAIIDMAHALNFSVVAEGVETEAQAAFLRNLGCEQAQGYFFAEPLAGSDFSGLLSPQPSTAMRPAAAL